MLLGTLGDPITPFCGLGQFNKNFIFLVEAKQHCADAEEFIEKALQVRQLLNFILLINFSICAILYIFKLNITILLQRVVEYFENILVFFADSKVSTHVMS